MSDKPDEDDWRSVRRGDERAFARIWDRHFARIVRRLVAAGAPFADAEELAALTFLEAWRHRHRVRIVDGSALPWLLVTSHNILRNDARARRRYAALLHRLPRPEDTPDPAETVEQSDVSPALRDALAALSPAERSLLVLVGLEGIPVKDAALAAGLKESTARMRLSRIRTKLQSITELRLLQEGEFS